MYIYPANYIAMKPKIDIKKGGINREDVGLIIESLLEGVVHPKNSPAGNPTKKSRKAY
jgi:hypothetical protein